MKNKISHRIILVLFSISFTLLLSATSASGDMVMPSGDVIIHWNNISLDTIKTAQYTAVKTSRVLAMVHVAMFDAINSIDDYYQPYYVNAVVTAPTSHRAAAAAAAHHVLMNLFPAQSATLNTALSDYLMGITDGDEKTNGISLGESVGDQIIALRTGDHSGDMVPYTPGNAPGDWQPTPPGYLPAMMPNWATVTPFTMTSQSQFRTIAPPALTSAEYAANYNEVKEIGWKFSTTRTSEQTALTMFWVDMPGTITTVGRWNVIAQNVAISKSNTMRQNAQLFAKLNLALADAAIVAWDYKYNYELWRPITAIMAGSTDGNPATIEDPNWEPLITTPAFPEYVSAHSCFSATAAQVLKCFFGRDNISFTVASYMMMPMTYRSYQSFTQAAEEAGMSRIYGGIHFSHADSAGQSSGRALADYVWNNYLQPLNARLDTDGIDTDGDGDPNNDNVELRMAAGDGFTNMADGKLQYMFGFSNATGIPDNMVIKDKMLGATFPAPTIVLKEGQKLYLTLTNVGMMHRPDLFDPHTIHWHGFPNAAPIFDGVPDASISINMGGNLTYYYNVVEPGTYMWHCHVEATEHMQMGMLGQLYVLPLQDNTANGTDLNGFTHQEGYKYIYNDGDGSTYYDVDYPVQIASFDPAFHDASFDVQPLPFANMDDKYPMLNGRGYPDTVDPNVLWSTASAEGYMDTPSRPLNALITATVGEKIALRMSSLSTTSFHTLTIPGIPMRVVGTGSRLLKGPDGRDTGYLTNSVTLGGGQAVDVVLDTADIEPGTYVLYASELNHLSNNTEDYGGMMTEIRITAP